MPVFEIHSARKRRAEQGEPEVYQYDHVPGPLRMQVRHILDGALGRWDHDAPSYFGNRPPQNNGFLQKLHNLLLREKGLPYLFKDRIDPKSDILEAVVKAFPDVDDWLDVVELCFRFILVMRDLSEGWRKELGVTQDVDDAIKELNTRFRQAGFGYQFEAGQIIRVDSQFLHAEVVKPALSLLADPRFAGAQEEFLSAHAHYRAGEYEDAILDANRAFESTMKAVCDIRGEGWEYSKGARASDLVKIIRRNGLLPDYLDQSFDQLIATLQSGLPRVRNEVGGHGQGATPRETPSYVAGYALHLAAANIVLLVEALKETEG
jgi:hypothetical protein